MTVKELQKAKPMLDAIKKFINFIIGILLLPVCIACAISLFRTMFTIGLYAKPMIYFTVGVCTYTAMHLVIFVPDRFYNIEYAILGKFLRVTGAGDKQPSPGETPQKSSPSLGLILGLIPHFIPVYTVVVTLAYIALKYFYNKAGQFSLTYAVLMGACLSFHVIFTADMMRKKQADLYGSVYLTSIFIIFIVNVTITALLLKLVYSQISIDYYFSTAYKIAKDIYLSIYQQLFG